MIKATGTNSDGEPVLIIGLSRGNCEKLLAGQPIPFKTGELGLPQLEILIMAGETETAMYRELRDMGILKNTAVHEDKRLENPNISVSNPGHEIKRGEST